MYGSKPTSAEPPRLSLREAQARLTRDRIREAGAALLGADGDPGAITFKAVAEGANVTEMTVYRHFPNREALLAGIWDHLNEQMAPGLVMPSTLRELKGQQSVLFSGFDRIAPQIIAAISTPQGREMRASMNDERQTAFLAIAAEIAPQLGAGRRRQLAALLQLLHSAYAWASLREQWGFTGEESADATQWLIEIILEHAKEPLP